MWNTNLPRAPTTTAKVARGSRSSLRDHLCRLGDTAWDDPQCGDIDWWGRQLSQVSPTSAVLVEYVIGPERRGASRAVEVRAVDGHRYFLKGTSMGAHTLVHADRSCLGVSVARSL